MMKVEIDEPCPMAANTASRSKKAFRFLENY
jgi:hypothetical protein